MTWSYPNGFSVSQAIAYANFCQQAYFQYYVLANTPPDFGYPAFTKFMQLPPSGYRLLYNLWYNEGVFEWDPVYFGYVACSQTDSTQVVIAIRGTENSEEWYDDIMDSMQVNSPIQNSQGLVHQGFAIIYNGQAGADGKGLLYYTPPSGPLVPPTSADQPVPLSTVLSGAKSVVVTGHSLGAALSVLLTLDIALNIKCPVSSYNFASPMVGDPIFANCFNQLLGETTPPISANYRVANGMDVVPNLPSNVFYAPGSPQEWNYMQVNGYCPVDSGILSVLADAHSLSNYAIGLNNLNGPPQAVTSSQRGAAGLRSIPRWQDKKTKPSQRAA
jgi:hypothetical protein